MAAEQGDFHLGHGSSCIDTGTELAATDIDLDGTARPIDGTGDGNAYWDIGCYEAPTPTIPLQTAVVLHDEEGVAPSSPSMSVTVTGSQLTGLTYEWWSVRNAGGTVTTNVVTGVGADYVFENLPLGSYTFVSVVRNDQGYAVTNETDKTFLSLIDTAYVSTTGSAVWPYATPETAAQSLMEAIPVAKTVRVLPGTYAFEHFVDEETEQECQAVFARGVSVEGGANPEDVIIDCGGKGGFVLNHPDAALSGMTFVNSQIETDTGSTLYVQSGQASNIVIRGSSTAARPVPFLYVGEGAGASDVTVTDCTVKSALGNTGIVKILGGRLANSRIASCVTCNRVLHADWTTSGARPVLENVKIQDNTATGTGFLSYLSYGSAKGLVVSGNTSSASDNNHIFVFMGSRVENSVFVNNVGRSTVCSGTTWSGGDCTLVNCLVSCNTNRDLAAVNSLGESSRVTVESCTIINNQSASGEAGGVRGGVKDQHGSYFRLLNSVVWGNTVADEPNDAGSVIPENYTFTASHSCFREAALYPAANNLSVDPLLKANGKLTGGSPCIGAGLSQPWHAEGVDLDGNRRVRGKGVDLGCYEFCGNPLVIIFR